MWNYNLLLMSLKNLKFDVAVCSYSATFSNENWRILISENSLSQKSCDYELKSQF